MVTSIAAMSISMANAQMQQAWDLSLMKNAMNQEAAQALALVEDIQQSVPAPAGRLDILV